MTEKRHLIITGQVQGVGYRASMAMAARSRGVTGWVRNRRDGSVEAVIAGSAEAVASMIDWARRGPAGADVAHVHVELGSSDPEDFGDFDQLPTA